MDYPRPQLYASKCLGFCACWWNGSIINSEFIEQVKEFADFVTHCPEVEIGLGVPRKWIRIVMKDDVKTLVQPATGADITEKMAEYIAETVPSLSDLDGFILRDRSPSCSLGRVKYYKGPEKSADVLAYGPGFFGEAVLASYGNLPIESDGRLKDQKLREHFLTKIFTLADFRRVKESGKMRELVDYHSRNKYLFMTFGQVKLKRLGQITSNPEKLDFVSTATKYEAQLHNLLSDNPRSSNIVNVATKIYGYFSKDLSASERNHFKDQMSGFRKGTIPLFSIRTMLQLWSIRFEDEYIMHQTFFQPFPAELNEIAPSEQY